MIYSIARKHKRLMRLGSPPQETDGGTLRPEERHAQ